MRNFDTRPPSNLLPPSSPREFDAGRSSKFLTEVSCIGVFRAGATGTKHSGGPGPPGPATTNLPAVDPETVSPPAEPDLDAIAADLAAVETALDELEAGTFRHDIEPPAS